MNKYIVIPAHMGSVRLPGKPLIRIAGKSLLQRCYETCIGSLNAERAVIVTPDTVIYDEVASWGIPGAEAYWLKDSEYRNGTERVAGLVDILDLPDDSIVVNVQSDMFGFMTTDFIDGPVRIIENGLSEVATAVTPQMTGKASDTSIVKATIEKHMVTPYPEIEEYFRVMPGSRLSPFDFQHVGVYAARASSFRWYLAAEPLSSEITFSLEQLRWKNNLRAFVVNEAFYKVDTQADLDKAEDFIKWRECQKIGNHP